MSTIPNLADLIQSVVPHNAVPSFLLRWEPGKTPLSDQTVVFSVLGAYLATIFTIRALMSSSAPFKLNFLFRAHNLFLTTLSGVLLALMVEEIAPIWWKTGTFDAICDHSSWTPRLELYYMINYYTKYLELVDTLFLVLKKKPLAFLHVYHHSATAYLCFTQLQGRTVVSWVPITLNLTVHVLMYYYYFRSAGGAKIWWKKHLTTMQITQFVIDLVAVYFSLYQRLAYNGTAPKTMAYVSNCSGTLNSAYFGCAILSSYLLLFIQFFIKTYSGKKAPKAAVTNGTNGTNGKSKAH